MIEYPDGTQVLITRTIAAGRDALFGAFTDADVMARWMWGENAPGVVVESDPRVGGGWSAYMDAPDGDGMVWPGESYGMRGIFVVVDRPERLAYTLNWDAPVGYNVGVDPATLTDEAVVVDFREAGDGTELTFRHIGIPDDGVSAPEHASGVDATLDVLERLLAGG